MATQVTDKVVIVTGSNAGLGEAIAIMFASRGAKVTICGRDEERLKSAFDKAVMASGGHQDKILAIKGDLNDANIRREIVDQTVRKFGRLDVLVANAGVIGPVGSFLNETEETYNKVMDTNLKSVFFLVQPAVPHLEQSKGNIIVISSHVSTRVLPPVTVYSMSKAALDHLTRCLAVDLGSKEVRVNSVNPGYFPTLIARDIEHDMEEAAKSEREKQPLKGRIGIAEDVAEAVIFLASDSAGFITGEHIIVDGGRSYA